MHSLFSNQNSKVIGRSIAACALLTSAMLVACQSEDSESNDIKEKHLAEVADVGAEGEQSGAARGKNLSRIAASDRSFEIELFESECCSSPGQINECWFEDAKDDGAYCEENDECASGQCNLELNVCVCENDAECDEGVCTSHGLCGPSWCNGYKMCSCWGGCQDVSEEQSHANVCASNSMTCCEGNYSVHPDLKDEERLSVGYCSNDAACTDGCKTDTDCPSDNNACTVDICDIVTGECVYDVVENQCDDYNECTNDSCDRELGCVYENNTDTCDDNSVCTLNDVCSDGACVGAPIDCADDNECTDDSCDPVSGCVFENNTAECDDNNACTTGDVCTDGACSGTARNCDDGNPCTDDACDGGSGCVYTLNKAGCDDGNACTVRDTCSNGVCVSGVLDSCDDGNLCTDDSCDIASGCVNTPNANSCDDSNACTMGDTCENGVCVSGEERNCDDGNACTDAHCDPVSGCVVEANVSSCNDGNSCTQSDVCQDGVCSGTPVGCDDGNYCTDDGCNGELGCSNTFNDNPCDDNNICSVDDSCSQGACSGVIIYWRFEDSEWNGTEGEVSDSMGNYHGTTYNEAYIVEDGKVGRAARFGEGHGSHAGGASTGYYLEGTPHTLAFWVKYDTVSGRHQTLGSFAGAGKRLYLGVDRDNQIFAGYGNSFVGWSKDSVPSTIEDNEWVRMVMTFDGDTVHVYVNGEELISFEAEYHFQGKGPEFHLGTQDGGVAFDEVIVDGRYWSPDDIDADYDNGNGPGPYRYVKSCDDDNPCTDDYCDPIVGCTHINNSGSCDDGNACTSDDTCSAGACIGSAIECDDGNVCTDDTCDEELGCTSVNNTSNCDDADMCTSGDVCLDGVCMGEAISCDDNNSCTDDSCNPISGCVFDDNSSTCDDNNLCTENDVCSDGTCEGETIVCDDEDVCTTNTCNPATGCVFEELDPCPNCNEDADCAGVISCDSEDGGCNTLRCVEGTCSCVPDEVGSYCTDIDEAQYPTNCYVGMCNAEGSCLPTMKSAGNNLCSDVFEAEDRTSVDTASEAYLGAFENTDATGSLLEVTGGTICANNNYSAGGEECEEYSSGDAIGKNGLDVVYAFSYQTNSTNQYELYSYIIKVEADYDVGMYISTDILSADDCPEGDNPGDDEHSETFMEVVSARCNHPYQNSPMPPVVEDECMDDGNALNSQGCCDPCVDGDDCGYKWCKRGYNYNGTDCDMCEDAGGPGYDAMTHKGNCDALWVYPDDPYDCSSQTPDDGEYDDYDYVATAVISPDGRTDGSWKDVFIFIDGVDASQGNFYLTVEKRRWWAGPCDRVEDDARVYDITDVGSGGEVFQGTLEGIVNSVHSGGGSCGGYSCESRWSGATSCHNSMSETELWPNQEFFKIHRSLDQGDQTYCIMSNESIASGADLVASIYKRRSDTALTICDQSYSGLGCKHESGDSSFEWEFEAEAGYLYLLEISQYNKINRVCSSSANDDCRYQISVREGACPATCPPLSAWYSGGAEGTILIDGSTFNPDSVIDGDTSDAGNHHTIGTSGWNGPDDVWKVDVLMDSTVNFSGCENDGYGAFNGKMALYDCSGNLVAANNDACGNKGMPTIEVDLLVSNQPYYLVVDGKKAGHKGAYGIGISYE